MHPRHPQSSPRTSTAPHRIARSNYLGTSTPRRLHCPCIHKRSITAFLKSGPHHLRLCVVHIIICLSFVPRAAPSASDPVEINDEASMAAPTTRVERNRLSTETVNAWVKEEMKDPRLANLESFLAAKTLPFPGYLPMQYPNDQPTFYVRTCYPEYYEHLMRVFNEQKEVAGVTTTGTPGIGKSVFMAYFFLRFRLENPTLTVALEAFTRNSRMKTIMVWHNGVVQEYVRSNPVAMMKALEPYVDVADITLLDGPPEDASATNFFVCFTSPNEQWRAQTVKDTSCRCIYMPVWDVDELRQAAVLLGLDELLDPLAPAIIMEVGLDEDKDVDVIQGRASIFGGVARACLQRDDAIVRDLQVAVNAAIYKATNVVVADTTAPTAPTYDERHRLFHFFLPDPTVYDVVVVDVGSSFIKKRLLARMDQLEDEKKAAFRRLLFIDPLTMSVAGSVVEQDVHGMLSAGTTVPARRLDNGNVGAPVMKSFVVERSNAMNKVVAGFELSSLMGKGPYFVPESRNWTSIDSFYYRVSSSESLVLLFQVTVSVRHPVQSEGLVDVLSRLKVWGASVAKTVSLVFIVPDKIAARFKKQRIVCFPSVSESSGMRQVYGIGPTRSKELTKLGIETVAQLVASSSQSPEVKMAKEKLAQHRERQAQAGENARTLLEAIPQYVWGLDEPENAWLV